jgi:hypothetical protein
MESSCYLLEDKNGKISTFGGDTLFLGSVGT